MKNKETEAPVKMRLYSPLVGALVPYKCKR